MNQRSALMGLHCLQITKFRTWRMSREVGTKKTPTVVQDNFTNWIQSCPMKTQDTSETMSCLQRFFPPSQKPEIIHTDKSKYFLKDCQDLQWNHDASTPHRADMNGVAERVVRRVKEETAIELVQKANYQKNGGTVRWNAIVTCATCTTLWPMSRQHSTRDLARHLTDHQFLLDHWLSTYQ